jgi:simple sugar transport system permease protein
MEALLEAALRLAAPLLIAALGELVVERAGVVNIGVEGTMLTGAFAGFATAVATDSAGFGVLAAAAAGCGVGLLFAAFAVVRKTDQIVVGMAVNLLALGVTGLGARALYAGATPSGPTIPAVAIPGLAELPWLGGALFQQTPFVYGGLIAAALVGFGLTRTRPGLRLRAVGEAAHAAYTEGVDVARVRIVAVLIGSALAGVAGAALSLAQSGTFTEGMTSGRGFIALAVVIFGRWSAAGVVLAALFFGSATALQFRLQAQGVDISYPVFLMFPYVVTLAVLGFVAAQVRVPGDLGKAYHRERERGRV